MNFKERKCSSTLGNQECLTVLYREKARNWRCLKDKPPTSVHSCVQGTWQQPIFNNANDDPALGQSFSKWGPWASSIVSPGNCLEFPLSSSTQDKGQGFGKHSSHNSQNWGCDTTVSSLLESKFLLFCKNTFRMQTWQIPVLISSLISTQSVLLGSSQPCFLKYLRAPCSYLPWHMLLFLPGNTSNPPVSLINFSSNNVTLSQKSFGTTLSHQLTLSFLHYTLWEFP